MYNTTRSGIIRQGPSNTKTRLRFIRQGSGPAWYRPSKYISLLLWRFFFLTVIIESGMLMPARSQSNEPCYQWEKVNGINIFYRKAGNPANHAIVLLHGFPSSSIMYEDLIRLLGNDFFLIAPDYPAHGYSDAPSPEMYRYTFENITNTMDSLLEKLGIHKYSLFMQDYGAPVGFRLAVKHPERIEALIVQNGNAYMEGFPEAQDPNGELQQYWKDKNKKYEDNWINYYREANAGTPDQWKLNPCVNPDRRVLNASVMLKPGRLAIFMDLWFDYGNNVKSYPLWHAYFAKYQPPMLITWGKEDTYFIVPGALAYLHDLPKAEIHLLNGGHWAASEANAGEIEIAQLIKSFFERNIIH